MHYYARRPFYAGPPSLPHRHLQLKNVCYGCYPPALLLSNCFYCGRQCASFQHYVDLEDNSALIREHESKNLYNTDLETIEFLRAANNQTLDFSNDLTDEDVATMYAWLAVLLFVIDSSEAIMQLTFSILDPDTSHWNSYRYVLIPLLESK